MGVDLDLYRNALKVLNISSIEDFCKLVKSGKVKNPHDVCPFWDESLNTCLIAEYVLENLNDLVCDKPFNVVKDVQCCLIEHLPNSITLLCSKNNGLFVITLEKLSLAREMVRSEDGFPLVKISIKPKSIDCTLHGAVTLLIEYCKEKESSCR